jgi:hypothetical protein
MGFLLFSGILGMTLGVNDMLSGLVDLLTRRGVLIFGGSGAGSTSNGVSALKSEEDVE